MHRVFSFRSLPVKGKLHGKPVSYDVAPEMHTYIHGSDME